MNKEILKQILLENEKFILEQIGEIVPRENFIFPRRLKKACLLYGVRRSGKSTILFDLFKKHPDRSLYIDFEDERLTDFKMEDFENLRESFYELKPNLPDSGEVLFLLDEIQNVAGWEKFARRLVEREGVQVFATGSSSKIMPQEIHTALRGRSWSLPVFPFSFREYLCSKGVDLRKKTELLYGRKKTQVKNHFQEYLIWGGFPEESYLETEYEKRKVLKEYLDAMFFKDLVERFRVTNIPLLDHLKDKLFSSFSSKYSLNSFCRQYKNKFTFSKDKVFAYYRHFLDSMLLFEVRKFSESSYQRLRNPAKLYLVDNGLAKRVTSTDFGRLLENVVFLELTRKGSELFYFEMEKECDFIAKNDKQWEAYQVCWDLNESNREREFSGLKGACESLGLKEGTLLTYDQEGEEKQGPTTIHIKPVWKWLLTQS